MLHQIIPVVLTFNEEVNIHRTLSALSWAKKVIVLDSHSTDKTAEICASFKNVSFHERPFTHHAEQWNHAISLATDSKWILTLDADHIVSSELAEELLRITANDNLSNMSDVYSIRYDYAINGDVLSTSLYPAMKVFFKQGKADFFQDGHTQRLRPKSAINDIPELHGKIVHDDRKPYEQWLMAQHKYATLEVQKMATTPFKELSLNDKVRKIPFAAPLIIMPYLLLAKGLWRDGAAGWEYSKQRLTAELILQKKIYAKKSA